MDDDNTREASGVLRQMMDAMKDEMRGEEKS
jgi:hypothetical protein